jgi:PKD repeat protein
MGITNFTLNTINNTSANGSAGYQNFTCTNSTTLNVGQNYSVTITNGTQYNENVRIWLDMNNNGTFETVELIFTSDDKRVHTGTLNIPATAVANTALRLRVTSDYFSNTNITPCGAVQYGQHEDYTVILLANQAPTADFTSPSANTCNRTISFFDNTQGGATSWKWYFGDGDSSSVQNPTHTYQSAGTYTVTLYVENANGTSSIEKTDFVTIYGSPGPNAAACAPQTTGTCCGIGIYRVQLADIDNSSAAATEGYQDFTCSAQTNLISGSNYTIQIKTGTQFAENVRVWIDFNNNNSFESGELVMSTNNVQENHSANFSIPSNATINTPLRMRVISDYNGITSPCNNVQYGQAEDYTIYILPNTIPPVSNFVANFTTTCTGIVSFTDQTQNNPTSWVWYFGNGDSSTVQNPTYTYSTAGVFTVTLITTNQYGTDTLIRTNYINFTGNSGPIAISCQPITTSHCCGIGIANVTLNSINNTTAVGTDSYQDYTCTQQTELFVSANYSISVRTGTQYVENVVVWIDYNNDGVFSNTNEIVMNSTGVLQNHSTNFTVPTTAVLNQPLRMRVISDYNTIVAACDNVAYGQVEDYTVTVRENTNPPVAQFSANTTTSCNGVISFTDESQNQPTEWKWYFGDGDSSSVQNPTHVYTTTGTFTVQLITTNAFGTNSVQRTNYITITATNGPLAANCSPATTGTCCGIGIYNVTFNTINNTTQPGTDGYRDYSCSHTTTIERGRNYAISIRTGTQYSEYVRVWIDLNNNGNFENSEEVFSSSAVQFHNGTITIPANFSLLNTGLRMRVASDYNTIANACNEVVWGQFEDYTVIITTNTSAKNQVYTNNFSVYPNPNTGNFILKYTTTHHSELRVTDMLGKIIYTEMVNANELKSKEINLSDVKAGVYLLTITNQNEKIVSKLIIE